MSDAASRVFDTLTDAQRNVLGQIAINMDIGHNRQTLRALINRGLIKKTVQTLAGRYPIQIERYELPIAVHIAWCRWCDENFDGDGNPRASATIRT